jgi:integrase
VAHAEKRGNQWRARWYGPDGKLNSEPGFSSRRAAEKYGHRREAETETTGTNALLTAPSTAPKNQPITLTNWVNIWYPALDLEPSTLEDYRNRIEVRILPAFGDRILSPTLPPAPSAEEIAVWEKNMIGSGYARSTARASRSLLATILGDAVAAGHLSANPAARRRGRGRKGGRRLERLEQAEKVWATLLQALLVAERCAMLSGHDTDFVTIITIAYTAMRWSETVGLPPDCIHPSTLNVHWKLYELDGHFYRGRPKDGSMRTIDIPPFLHDLLTRHLNDTPTLRCGCQPPNANLYARYPDVTWCAGTDRYVFLGPQGGHPRRSTHSRRIMRPAADGWYPATHRAPAMPVLVDATTPPGKPLTPWPAAVPGQPFTPPRGRGRARIPEDMPLASWLPVLTDLTAHGLRHGHQTWMDDNAIPYVLQSQRMGHDIPGIRGVYAHVSPTMRTHLIDALQEAWETSLAARARLDPHSAVPILDELLAPYRTSQFQDRLPVASQNPTSRTGRSTARHDHLSDHASELRKHWSGWRDSNPRPLAPKASALPSCATPRYMPPQVYGPTPTLSPRPDTLSLAPSPGHRHAGVAQWQSPSLPSWPCGFDSRHPLQTA